MLTYDVVGRTYDIVVQDLRYRNGYLIHIVYDVVGQLHLQIVGHDLRHRR